MLSSHIKHRSYLRMSLNIGNRGISKKITEVEEFLSENTSTTLKEAVIEVCTALREKRRGVPQPEWGDEIGDMVIRQVDLEQRATIAGIWDPEWTTAQEEYHETVKSRKKEGHG